MKTTRHGEFMYYSKSHGWQVASVFLAIISWFLCTVFYDNSMYRKRSAHMTERENICTSNLVRHKLILIEEKRTILPTYFSIGREFTLISRMTDIHSQWNSQGFLLLVYLSKSHSPMFWSILVGCDFYARELTLRTSKKSIL